MTNRFEIYEKLKEGNIILLDTLTNQKLLCTVPPKCFTTVMSVYNLLGDHPNLVPIYKYLDIKTGMFLDASQLENTSPSDISLVLKVAHGNLYQYLQQTRLYESQAKGLFFQICSLVEHGHQKNIVWRDLRAIKFEFKNPEKTHLRFLSCETAMIVPPHNDIINDRCNAVGYTAPEILLAEQFSGKAADCWSLGILLYLLLVGAYPFHDLNKQKLQRLIVIGKFEIPERISPKAKCLLISLLRKDNRLTANDVLDHQWFHVVPQRFYYIANTTTTDQLVPEMEMIEMC